MKEIVINKCYGGFGLSKEAKELYSNLANIPIEKIYDVMDSRDDPYLVEVVRRLGDKANGMVAKLKVVEIPDDVEWIIQEYDGVEWIAEKHRTWE